MSREKRGRVRSRADVEGAGCCRGGEPRVHGLLQGWLLLLLAERNDHGYRLVERVAQELPEEMVPDPAVLYRMLRRLEAEGAVGSRLESGERGPARKVYALTEAGQECLSEWKDKAEKRLTLLRRFLTRLAEFEEDAK